MGKKGSYDDYSYDENFNSLSISKSKYPAVGKHLVIDLHGCNLEYLNDDYKISEILSQCCLLSNSTEICKIIKQFKPQGITGILLLEESHIAIHTYPEHNVVFIDIFTCGDEGTPLDCVTYLAEIF